MTYIINTYSSRMEIETREWWGGTRDRHLLMKRQTPLDEEADTSWWRDRHLLMKRQTPLDALMHACMCVSESYRDNLMYVCMYAWRHVCMYVCIAYVCMYAAYSKVKQIFIRVCMYVNNFIFIDDALCVHVCMHVLYVCVCMQFTHRRETFLYMYHDVCMYVCK